MLVAVGIVAVVALMLGVVISKLGRGGQPVAKPTTSSSAPPSPGGVKAPLQGLIDRQGEPPVAMRGVVSAWVVNVRWADLQPSDGTTLATPNAIDQGIDEVRSLNQANPAQPFRLKIRLSAGVDAPDWLKDLGGPPLAIRDPTSQTTGTVGRFWTDDYGRAYDRLQQLLAARYDTVPEIAEVTVSRCSTVYAETFIRQIADPHNVQEFLASGDTPDADERCLHEQVDAHRVWAHTLSGLALNPYQKPGPSGRDVDEPFTESIMSYCRKVLGPRCVLENNSIRWPSFGGTMAQMYQAIRRAGPPISFQTAAPERIGDLQKTLEWAAEQGANAVELPRSYPTYPLAMLRDAADSLRRNRTTV